MRIIIEYTKSQEWFHDNFDKIWTDIVYSANKDMNDWAKWLSHCKTRLVENDLELVIKNPMIFQLLGNKGIDKYIKKWIAERFDLSFKVMLKVDVTSLEAEQIKYNKKKKQEDSKFIKNAISTNNNGIHR